MRHMPEGEWVYITEGIEDALVVRQVRPAFRIVCAGSLVNMGAILLPEQAKTIVIVCDRDPSERAQDQLERAIGRHQARGIKVRLVFPGEGYKDYNEWLLGLQAEERRQKP
jgi:hypothetical protein